METLTQELRPTVVSTTFSEDQYTHTNHMSDGTSRHYTTGSDSESYLTGVTSAEEVSAQRAFDASNLYLRELTVLGPDLIDFYGGKDNIQGLGN